MTAKLCRERFGGLHFLARDRRGRDARRSKFMGHYDARGHQFFISKYAAEGSSFP